MKHPPEPICPLVPPELMEEAAKAELRKDAALERLQRLAEEAPPHQQDAFERALIGVIDADKAMRKARKR
jgi:hypothetical protein